MIKPTVGRITSPFGFRNHPIQNKVDFHHGIDYSNVKGHDDILSISGGTVKHVGNDKDGYGLYIVIEHDGYCSLYAHLHEILVVDEQKVTEGQKIALKGTTGSSTGIHLHFEIRKGSYSRFWYKYSNNEWKYSVDADLFLQAHETLEINYDVPSYFEDSWKWALKNDINDGVVQNPIEPQVVEMLYRYDKYLKGSE